MTDSSTPLVSVVMPAYGAEAYIEAAIASVQAQTHENWELLVMDDCSPDGCARIAEAMAAKDSRIRLIRNEKNMGVARTRNRGLDLCRGDYVALLDSDDLWRPEKLEKQLALAKKEQADIIYCSYAIIDEHGKQKCADYIVPAQTNLKKLLVKNVISCSAVMLEKQTAQAFRFPTDYYHEDFALWLDMLRSGKKAVGQQEVLGDYRVHSGSRASNKAGSAKRRWKIYRSFMGLSLAESSWYLGQYALAGFMKYLPKQGKQEADY